LIKSYREELHRLREQGLYRQMRQVTGAQGEHVGLNGRNVLLLCSNNYLGIADHPLLKEAAIRAVEAYGCGAGASRLVSGTMELHTALEHRIAAFKNTESALVFNSGYAANSGVIPALMEKGDVIFCDRLNHASIVDGCLLSRAQLVRYPHNDMAALRRLLAERCGSGRQLIITDGVFSMDGDLAPLAELVALKREFGALLMVDDAHGTGVLGDSGRGTAEHYGVSADIDIHMGTLGKAFGGFGAFIAASHEIVEYLVNRARTFIFTTALPPAVLAAAHAAVDLVDSAEGSTLRCRLSSHAQYFRAEVQAAGFEIMGSETQIVPLLVGATQAAMDFSRYLLEQDIFVQGIRPPTVPVGTSRLRCTLMASHSEGDVTRAVTAIIATAKRLGLG
jgi:glycine C-acetyltransferase